MNNGRTCEAVADCCLRYRVFVGKVELSGVFEDEMLALLPLWVLVFQINSESFNMLDPWRDTATVSAGMFPLSWILDRVPFQIIPFQSLLQTSCTLKCFNTLLASLRLVPFDLHSFPCPSFTII